MTAIPLSSGPVMGVLSASGSSPVFSSTPGHVGYVLIGLSRLAVASGPKLMRSADGGSTWAAMTITSAFSDYGSPNGASGPSLLYIVPLIDTAPAQYRIDVTLSGGSLFFRAVNFETIWNPCSIIEPGDANGSVLSITTSQLLSLYTARDTPLALAQIAAPLTIFKQLWRGVPGAIGIAKLSIPYGAQTGFDNTGDLPGLRTSLGANRVVRATSVQVVAIQNLNGNSLSSGTSFQRDITDTYTTYTVGSTVQAKDLGDMAHNLSTGPFSGPTCRYGIHGFTTLLEAACTNFAYMKTAPFNLAALGL